MEQALKDIAAQLDGRTTTPPIKEAEEALVKDYGQEQEIESEEYKSGLEGDNDEADEGGESREGEGDDIRTLSQLAKAIEVEPEYLYGMEINMGGNQPPITLGKLKDAYQDAVRSSGALKEQLDLQTKELEQARHGMGRNQQASTELQNATAELTALQKEYNNIDWPRYKSESPGEAALALQEYQAAGQAANYKIQQVTQYQSQQEEARMAQEMQTATSKLHEVIPEWKDPEVRKADVTKIRNALVEAGYPEDALSGTTDWIAISLMRELVMRREKEGQAVQAMEKVRVAPKVIRGRGQASGVAQRTNELVNLAKTSGNKNDALSAAKALLNGRR
jgi:hypothetical protein